MHRDCCTCNNACAYRTCGCLHAVFCDCCGYQCFDMWQPVRDEEEEASEQSPIDSTPPDYVHDQETASLVEDNDYED